MCKGRKKNPAAVRFCRCCRAASIHHPELIARERGASRHGDSAPAAITIRTGSGGGPRGRGEARTGLKDGGVCLRLLMSTVALGLLELVCLEEIFWQLLKIPACRDPPPSRRGAF